MTQDRDALLKLCDHALTITHAVTVETSSRKALSLIQQLARALRRYILSELAPVTAADISKSKFSAPVLTEGEQADLELVRKYAGPDVAKVVAIVDRLSLTDTRVVDETTRGETAMRGWGTSQPELVGSEATDAGVGDARDRLEKERTTLLNSFGHGAYADGLVRDCIKEIDALLATPPQGSRASKP